MIKTKIGWNTIPVRGSRRSGHRKQWFGLTSFYPNDGRYRSSTTFQFFKFFITLIYY